MDNFNFQALIGIPFGILFLINGLWDKSPFVIPYFKRIQQQRWGVQGLKVRMILTGAGILVLCVLAFFRVIC